MLGIDISQATVAKYMIRRCKPPSQTWWTILDNHARDLVSIDFFIVPTATFRILYGCNLLPAVCAIRSGWRMLGDAVNTSV